MNNDVKKYIENLVISDLADTDLGDRIKYAMHLYEKIQINLYALSDKKGDEKNTIIKAATVGTFSILKLFASGKRPSEITSDDWKKVAEEISEYAVLQDNTQYVVFIFKMYEQYIRFSAMQISTFASEDNVKAVMNLADEISIKTDELNDGKLEEVRYIEDCLWLAFESMIKLLSSLRPKFISGEYAELSQAIATYAFEYGRFMLYKKEQALLNEYISMQHELDDKLKAKYDDFIQELTKQTETFYVLIDHAFAPDFREAFMGSIELANASGVSSNDVLITIEDIDDYFL